MPSVGKRFADTDAPGTRSVSPSEIVFVTHVQIPSPDNVRLSSRYETKSGYEMFVA